jgi:M-phase inducer tyrosine phosphatase
MSTPPMDIEGTTPPVPSSSPGIDSMDISPLPHKQPYFVHQVTLPSPSPVEMVTPDEQSDDLLSPPEDFPTPTADTPSFLQLPE